MATKFENNYDCAKFPASQSNQVQEYIESIKRKAENLVLNEFPERIVLLNNVLESAQFKNRALGDIQQNLNIPTPKPIPVNSRSRSVKKIKFNNRISYKNDDALKFINGSSPINQHIHDLILIVKPHIRKLVEDANLLKMWISFMIPKIEDGNNFGVSIQASTLAEIQAVESDGATFFDQITRYYISRGKLVSEVAKYPHVDDYRNAVNELDEKEYLSLWLMMVEIRNRYCALHDIVIKNYDKIKKPRTTNVSESFC